jgi:hypothetical protein
MRVEITITVLVLVNINLIDVKDTAVRILFHDPNAHLKGGSLRILGGGNDLGIVPVLAVIDLNITLEIRRRVIGTIAFRFDGI